MRSLLCVILTVVFVTLQTAAVMAATLQAYSGSRGGAKAIAIERASQICALEGKEMDIVNVDVEKKGDGSDDYTATLSYKCV